MERFADKSAGKIIRNNGQDLTFFSAFAIFDSGSLEDCFSARPRDPFSGVQGKRHLHPGAPLVAR